MTSPERKVPFVDFKSYYAERLLQFEAEASRVIQSGWYVGGPEVESFESAFSEYLGSGEVVSCANGTDAIELALRALGVSEDDLVIAPTHTAVATISAIERAGAKPLLVDVTFPNGSIDLDSVGEIIDLSKEPNRIAAVIVVHLYGFPVDLSRIRELLIEKKIALIEDCAQAHGALYQNRKVGTLGDFGTFSFYPTKNLGALGDGGAVWIKDPLVAKRLRSIKEYGWEERYNSEIVGVNSRLDPIQSAFLKVNLGYLDSDNARRQKAAKVYDHLLDKYQIEHGFQVASSEAVYHQYPLYYSERDELQEFLHESGVQSAVLYPCAVHQQAAYKGRVQTIPENLKLSERLVDSILCLPISPSLSDSDIEYVASRLDRYFEMKN